MADKDEIDEGIVEKVGENKAVPLLPQEEEESKELVIHVPEETAKSAEIGVLSVLVIIVIIASIVAIVYFVLDRRRQKKIKECVEKIEKTEEGKPKDRKKSSSKAPPLPPPPPPEPHADDQTTETATTSEEAPESDVNTEVTLETEALAAENANNNLDRNANARQRLRRLRRCCQCLCCPSDYEEPSLEEIWRQKQAKLKDALKDEKGARESLKLMEEGMRHMEGYQMFHHQMPHSFSGLRRHSTNPRRSRRRRSQSQPVSSHKFTSVRPSNENRSCWSQAAMQQRSRSYSAVGHRPGHDRSRKRLREGLSGRWTGHRHQERKRSHSRSALNPQHCYREHDRSNLETEHWLCKRGQWENRDSENQASLSPVHHGQNDRTNSHFTQRHHDHGQFDRVPNSSHHNKSQPKHSRIYYDKSSFDTSQSYFDGNQSCRDHSRNYNGRSQSQHVERHERRPSQYQCVDRHPDLCRHEVRQPSRRTNPSHCDEIRPNRKQSQYEPRHPERSDKYKYEQRHPDRRTNQHKHESRRSDAGRDYDHFEDRHPHRTLNPNDCGERHPGIGSSQHEERYSGRKPYPEQYEERHRERRSRQNHTDMHFQHVPSVARKSSCRNHHTYPLNSPALSNSSYGNLTGSSLQCSDDAEYANPAVLHHRERQRHLREKHRQVAHPELYENRNQSAYWPEPHDHSTPNHPPAPHHHSTGTYAQTRRTIPNTYYREENFRDESPCSHYDQFSESPYHYSHLNISQNQHCEDNDPTPLNTPSCDVPKDFQVKEIGLPAEKRLSKHNSENNDAGTNAVKDQICRKRAVRAHLGKARPHSKATNNKSHTSSSDGNRCQSMDSHHGQKENMASIVSRLFGLKLTSLKRPKKSSLRRTLTKKRRYPAIERQPLLTDSSAWDSEDTIYDINKDAEPVDSGCDISASVPSETHHFDLTQSLTVGRKSAENETGATTSEQGSPIQSQRGCRNEKVRKELILLSDEDCQKNLVSATAENSNDTVAKSLFTSPKRKNTCMDLNVSNVNSLSNHDNEEFRQLATQRWCKEQFQSLTGPPDSNPPDRLTSMDTADNVLQNDLSVKRLSSDTHLPVLHSIHGQSELSSQIEQREDLKSSYRSRNCDESPGKRTAADKFWNFDCSSRSNSLQLNHYKTVKPTDHLCSEIDETEFQTACYEQSILPVTDYSDPISPGSRGDSATNHSDLFDGFVKERMDSHRQQLCYSCAGESEDTIMQNIAHSINSPDPQLVRCRNHSESSETKTVPKFNDLHPPADLLTQCSEHNFCNVVTKRWPGERCFVSSRSRPIGVHNTTLLLEERSVERGHLSASILPQACLKD